MATCPSAAIFVILAGPSDRKTLAGHSTWAKTVEKLAKKLLILLDYALNLLDNQ